MFDKCPNCKSLWQDVVNGYGCVKCDILTHLHRPRSCCWKYVGGTGGFIVNPK